MKKLSLCCIFVLVIVLVVVPVSYAADEVTAEGFRYYIDGETVTITGYEGDAQQLVIPETIEGKLVTAIGAYAFNNRSDFTGELIIPQGVTHIGSGAFSGCSGFTGNLVIPDGVISIGDSAFSRCSGFTGDLVISPHISSIEEFAFFLCSGFTGELVIPEKVTRIGACAFSGCSGFTGKLVIPNGVISIGDSAFTWCSGFTGKLVIPDGVISIGNGAFSDCSGFTGDLIIPDNVTSIGASAFSNCSGFSGKLVLPDTLTTIGEDTFNSCSGLIGDVIIPESVTSIGQYAFYSCLRIQRVVIRNSEVRFGEDVFAFTNPCTRLVSYVGSTTDVYARANDLPFLDIMDQVGSVRGTIKTENPYKEAILRLLQDGAVKYTAIIPAAGEDGVQTFFIEDVLTDRYDLEIEKSEHLPSRITGITVDRDGVDLSEHFNASIVSLTSCAGDINGDGCIDLQDVALLTSSSTYGKTVDEAEFAAADVNGDGCYDLQDLAIVTSTNNYGKSNMELSFTEGMRVILPEYPTGFVTTETTYIETEYTLCQIDAGMYVPGDFAKTVDELCSVVEAVSGLSFGNSAYNGMKFLLRMRRDPDASAEGSAYLGRTKSDRGDECMHAVVLSSSSVAFAKETLIHEFSHVLRFCQSDYHYNTVLEEGFAAYVEWQTLQYLKENNPSLYLQTSGVGNALFNYACSLDIREHDMAFWMKQDPYFYRFGGTDNYSFGMRFMMYLDEVYGDYIGWPSYWEKKGVNYNAFSVDEEVQLFRDCYGAECFDNFYDWLDVNEYRLLGSSYAGPTRSGRVEVFDYTGVAVSTVIPGDGRWKRDAVWLPYNVVYHDLFINIEETVNFLRDSWGRNVDNLWVALSEPATVRLFDADGYLIRETTDRCILLSGVSYIQLAGDGFLSQMEIGGYYSEEDVWTDATVMHTVTVDPMQYFTWYNWVSASEYPVSLELMYRNDVTVVVKTSAPCDIADITSREWTVSTCENVTEIVVSNTKDFIIYNNGEEPVTVEFIVIPQT